MLTYGFPLAIIGMALKYAELKPVPCLTYSDAEKLRETCATPILKQVRNDVIRYRYGDEQHLEEALKRIFQYGLGGGIPRRSAPILQVIREEVNEDGKYCLVLVFEAKSLQLSDFERRQVRNDVIRYRYGDEQHLEEALKRIFQYGLGGGIPRRSASILQVIREEVNEDGKYCLVLVFEAKSLQLSDFERRQAKFASFFGPGITAEIGKGENDLYEVRLISDTTPQ